MHSERFTRQYRQRLRQCVLPVATAARDARAHLKICTSRSSPSASKGSMSILRAAARVTRIAGFETGCSTESSVGGERRAAVLRRGGQWQRQGRSQVLVLCEDGMQGPLYSASRDEARGEKDLALCLSISVPRTGSASPPLTATASSTPRWPQLSCGAGAAAHAGAEPVKTSPFAPVSRIARDQNNCASRTPIRCLDCQFAPRPSCQPSQPLHPLSFRDRITSNASNLQLSGDPSVWSAQGQPWCFQAAQPS